jgi:DNA-binding transcriptional ArsR family regulator
VAKEGKRPEKPKRGPEIIDQRLAKALANSLRVEILAVLSTRRISPVEFSREYGGNLSRTAYHFKVLERCGLIELAERIPHRGAIEHIYRSVDRPLLADFDWKQLPQSVQGSISGAMLRDLVTRATQAIEEGHFDSRGDRHFSCTQLLVDEKGWGELIDILGAAAERIDAVGERSSRRLETEGSEEVPVTVALAGFESHAGR